MLIFSNCEPEGRAATLRMNQQFTAQGVAYAQAARTQLPQMPQTAETPWKVMQIDCDVDNADAMRELLPLFQQARPLLLYLHGYNNTPAAFFERCDRLESLYGLEIVRFSWSSKQHLHDAYFHPGVDGGVGNGLQQELRRVFGSQACMPSTTYPAALYPLAGDVKNLTCAWWLLMASTGARH